MKLLGGLFLGVAWLFTSVEAGAAGARRVMQGTASCDEAARLVEFRAPAARLSSEARAMLDEVAIWAKDTPTRIVRLRDLSDEQPRTRARAYLAARRMDYVRSYLVDQGVDPTRIVVADADAGPAPVIASRRTVEVMTCADGPANATAAPGSARAVGADRLAPLAPAIAAAPATPTSAPRAATPRSVVPPPVAPPSLPVSPYEPAPLAVSSTAEARPRSADTSSIGVAAMVGAGVMGFVDDEPRYFTQPGGLWEARVGVGTRTPIAFEAAYLGSAQSIEALGLSSGAMLVGNGAEANLRLNFARGAVQPYVLGGVGWQHLTVTTAGANTSSLRDSDDVLTVPFGLGLTWRVGYGLFFDLRATARAAMGDDLMDAPFASTSANARLHTWSAGGRLGWEF